MTDPILINSLPFLKFELAISDPVPNDCSKGPGGTKLRFIC